MKILPKEWAVVKLPEVAKVNPTIDKSSYSDDLDVSFVPMPAVQPETGKIDVSQIKKFGEVKKGYTPFLQHDVLFAKITPCMENGKMAVVPALHNDIGLGSTEFHVLRAYEGIEPRYLYYFISSKAYRYDAEHNMTGAVGQKRVPTPYIEKSSIPIPPTNEQKRIVERIEELFSELDKGIEGLETAREQLKVYRQAVLKHAFEKFSERIALEAVSDAVGGYAFKSPSFKTDSGKYQVIRMGNLRPGLIREDESPVFLDEVDSQILERYLLKIDDVMITLTGTRNKRDYGYTAIVKKANYLVNQRIAYLRFSPQYIPSFFLYYSWTEDFKRQFFGHETGNVGQGNVGMKAIRTTLIPKATIAEQKRVIDALDASFATIENLETTIETELQKSKALRQSILKKAFSGQLVVQDPADEPASILMERIRAAKESQSGKKKIKEKRRAT